MRDRASRAAVGLLAVFAALTGCSDDGGEAADATTTSELDASTTTSAPAATTTAAPAPTTAAPATTTTEPPPTTAGPPVGFDTPEEAANALFDAWVVGDEARARQVAPDEVVDELFQTDGAFAGESYTFQGCFEEEDPEPVFRCSWTYEGGAMSLLVGDTDAFGLRVVRLEFLAD